MSPMLFFFIILKENDNTHAKQTKKKMFVVFWLSGGSRLLYEPQEPSNIPVFPTTKMLEDDYNLGIMSQALKHAY